jgi:protein Mpv17
MRPLLRASLLSCGAMAAGDAVQQALVPRLARPGTPHPPFDPARTARFAAVGALLHGPFFYAGFSALDRWRPGRDVASVIAKTAAGQATLFPTYLAAALFSLALLAGSGPPDAAAQTRAAWPRAFVAGCAFWPAANLVNFSVVPAGLPRVAFVNGAAVVWNAYLSLVAADAAGAGGAGGVKGKAGGGRGAKA